MADVKKLAEELVNLTVKEVNELAVAVRKAGSVKCGTMKFSIGIDYCDSMDNDCDGDSVEDYDTKSKKPHGLLVGRGGSIEIEQDIE